MKKRVITTLYVLIYLVSQVSIPVIVGAEKENPQSKVIVSMGDSFSSGEGIEKFYGQCDNVEDSMKSQDWLAHRSEKSWPGRLKLPALSDTKTMKDYHNTNWFFVATSGAETKHINGYFSKNVVRDGDEWSKSIDPQINIFSKMGNKKADYVTLTLGGNDADFTEVISKASLQTSLFNTNELTNKLNEVWDYYYADDGIREKLYNAYCDISEEAGPQAKIIVAGYPQLLCKSGGILFSEEAAKLVNDSVSRFNDEIETLVNQCKAEGKKICFVSVEEKFKDKGAYAKDAFINRVYFGPEDQDLDDTVGFSSYSIHPNDKGAKAYAEAVQEKINQIETEGEESEWPEMAGSEERDAVLVLDASGSMAGTPMQETKHAAKEFTDTVLYEDVGIGVVAYDDSALKICDFSRNKTYLQKTIENLNSGGGTNIEAGLLQAEQMLENDSIAKKKFIVLMSDGEPNEGKCGDELCEYADKLKEKGIRIYTLGFFSSLDSKAEAQNLMERIASEGCHFEVDDASQLKFFFDDIAEQIKGTKYYYIRIACPVDVTVKYDGETLSSEDTDTTQRAKFGTLTFEENTSEDSDDKVKILRLKEGVNYDIHIEGTGNGEMTYTIGYMDDNGDYSDMREFEDIEINKRTEIDTVVAKSKTTILKVDDDGDGKYDSIYKAGENESGELLDYKKTLKLLLFPVALLILLLVVLGIKRKIKKRLKLRNREDFEEYVPDAITEDSETYGKISSTPADILPAEEVLPAKGEETIKKESVEEHTDYFKVPGDL